LSPRRYSLLLVLLLLLQVHHVFELVNDADDDDIEEVDSIRVTFVSKNETVSLIISTKKNI
jgi:hypothetical protein